MEDALLENRNFDQQDFEANDIKPDEYQLRAGVRIILGALCGLAISGAGLYLGIFGVLPTLLIFVSLIIGMLVYGLWGLPAGCAMLVGACAGTFLSGGTLLAAEMLLGFVMPCAVCMAAIERRTPFFKTMKIAVIAQGAGYLSALALLALICGGDLGGVFGTMFRDSIMSLDENMLTSMLDMYSGMFAMFGLEIIESTPAETLLAISAYLEQAIKIIMPYLIVFETVINALFGTLIACCLRTRRGIEGASYEPISKWRLPARVTIGIIVLLIAGFILSKTSGSRGEIVLITMLGVTYIACCIQTLASLYDKMTIMQMRMWLRVLLLVLTVLCANFYVMLYGALSALIGSHGLIRQLRNKSDE